MKIKFQGLLTVESALAAVTQDGWALRYVDREAMTEAVALAAVTQNGEALQYVLNFDWFKKIAAEFNIEIE